MVGISSVVEEIAELKKSRQAVILAHHYQDPEIQELADSIGDSLELARVAQNFEGDVIALCGVWFMAETAKALNPDRIVVAPDRNAGCSLVDACPVDELRAWKRHNPGYAIVSYINTSIEVKAESDILCTSRNAVDIVNSIPADQPVMFLPDLNLGNYVQQQTGRQNMKIWPGTCIVHATFPARRVAKARARASARAGGRASGMSAGRAVNGRFHRLHLGHRRLVRALGRRRVYHHDRERRALFAGTRGSAASSFISSPTKTAIAANVRT